MFLLVDTGYASKDIRFWGMRVFNPERPFGLVNLKLAIKSFEIVSVDKKGVAYKRSSRTTDDSISCYAVSDIKGVVMVVFNNSKMPIEFNIDTDKYYSISKDGSFYKLTPTRKTYPETLNPKKYVIVTLTLNDISYTDIEYLMVLIDNGRCCIFLKQIKK